ncbi:tRNA (5-methylaminomethyl-2-thiouridine)(34)-methyltransferase MnmD [Flavobacterium sp.]|uniref:tRNA (5-methylaminomethyl-2-thiouridine)(34)-methyltransferase MnmD n=1 Tax=Flavobacterium sp. TaxID=239 RepID=UPI0026314472|nr:tRNA (5-methylaminomethyl-2-thiouridine)(34)-methyltransferase MnmD [Flavobacterium sp.]
MIREIITTSDGSSTIRLPEVDEHYHSKHGAIQEAQHVFIKNGLERLSQKKVRILEIGYGTGLNALLTALYAEEQLLEINYTGVEAYPIEAAEHRAMNYPELLDTPAAKPIFEKLFEAEWEQVKTISTYFKLTKRKLLFEQIEFKGAFDLIYFDAFGYRVQPDLWSADIFSRMYQALDSEGILVTYAARSVIKRNLESVGFQVQKVPGPPGKREMFVVYKRSKL